MIRWLKLKQACVYSAIGINRLVQLAEQGKIRAFKDPDDGRHPWIFDRESIDAYRLGQAGGFESEDKEALAIWEIMK